MDAGGVTREWYQVMSREMFNPQFSLFMPVPEGGTTFQVEEGDRQSSAGSCFSLLPCLCWRCRDKRGAVVPRTSACLALLLGLPHLPVAPSWHRTPHLMRPQQHSLSSLCYFELLLICPPCPPCSPTPTL